MSEGKEDKEAHMEHLSEELEFRFLGKDNKAVGEPVAKASKEEAGELEAKEDFLQTQLASKVAAGELADNKEPKAHGELKVEAQSTLRAMAQAKEDLHTEHLAKVDHTAKEILALMLAGKVAHTDLQAMELQAKAHTVLVKVYMAQAVKEDLTELQALMVLQEQVALA